MSEELKEETGVDEQTAQENNDREPEEKKDSKAEKKYTDADVDRLINKKFAELKSKAEADVEEAKKLAEMSAKEKIEYERDKLQEELTALKRDKARNEMKSTARAILGEQGIQVGDELLSMIVTDDAEATQESIGEFAAVFKAAVEQAVTEKMRGKTPKRSTTSNALTKQEIMDIKDPVERQRTIAKNLELFS